MILQIEGITTKEEAEKVIGKTVVWKSPAGKELKGKITFAHGNSGCVRALFETGMPGQSIAEEVSVQ